MSQCALPVLLAMHCGRRWNSHLGSVNWFNVTVCVYVCEYVYICVFVCVCEGRNAVYLRTKQEGKEILSITEK